MATTRPRESLVASTTIEWPSAYPWPPQATWVDPIRLGLDQLVQVERAPVFATIPDTVWGVVPFVLRVGGRRLAVAIDYSDEARLDESLLQHFDLVFKMQYLADGYPSPQVVPGGFVPNGFSLYRYLPHLRAMRDSRPPEGGYAYGRFGHDKRLDIRELGVGLLTTQHVFPYRGGFGRVHYVEALVEAARAGACIDLPGLGPLCFRLVDYLAIGVPIVSPRHRCRLHVPLEDNVEIVYCEPDLSDLVAVVERLLDEPDRAREVAAGARAYFDRHLDFRQLARYYLATCFDHL